MYLILETNLVGHGRRDVFAAELGQHELRLLRTRTGRRIVDDLLAPRSRFAAPRLVSHSDWSSVGPITLTTLVPAFFSFASVVSS